MTQRSYKLHLQAGLRFWLVGVGILSVLGPAFILFESATEGEPPAIVAGLVLVVFGVIWFAVLSTPHTINVLQDQRIEFVSVVRKKTVLPSEIHSIRPSGSQLGWLCIRHANGKVSILQQFSGFHMFLTELESANSAIELVGC